MWSTALVSAVLSGEHERWCNPSSKGGDGQGRAGIRPVIPEPPTSRVYGGAVISARACLALAPIPAAEEVDAGFLPRQQGSGSRVICQVISSASLRR